MAKTVDWRQLLAPEYVRQIEEEISEQFAAGWRAYGRVLRERMRDVPPPEACSPRKGQDTGSEEPASYPKNRAPRGLWPTLIERVLKASSPMGVSYPELMRLVQAEAQGYNLARSSFNVALEKVEGDGNAIKQNSLWFWHESLKLQPANGLGEPEKNSPQPSPFALGDAAD